MPMKIASVTVAEGRASVEIEGLETPIIVQEGQTLSLQMLPTGTQVVQFEWMEAGEDKLIQIAEGAPPGLANPEGLPRQR